MITKMEPIVIVYCFTIEGYNVFVTIEFFPYVSMIVDTAFCTPYDSGPYSPMMVKF